MKWDEKDEIYHQIMELLNINDEDECADIVSYLNDVDFELQKLICNLLKLREKSEPGRAALQKILKPVKPTRIMEYYLKKAGFTIRDKKVYKKDDLFTVYEDTFLNICDSGLFKEGSVILIITDSVDRNKVLRAARSHNHVFLRHEDGLLEKIK